MPRRVIHIGELRGVCLAGCLKNKNNKIILAKHKKRPLAEASDLSWVILK